MKLHAPSETSLHMSSVNFSFFQGSVRFIGGFKICNIKMYGLVGSPNAVKNIKEYQFNNILILIISMLISDYCISVNPLWIFLSH